MYYLHTIKNKIIVLWGSILFFCCYSSTMEQTPLYEYIQEGNSDGIRNLCQEGLHPDEFYKNNCWGLVPPPLIFSLLYKNEQQNVLKALIEGKADCNFKCSYGDWFLNASYSPPLLTAIKKGSDLETIKILLDNGANGAYYDEVIHESLFHIAASKENGKDICNLLVQNLCPHSLKEKSKALSIQLLCCQKKIIPFALLPKVLILKILSFSVPTEEARFLPPPHNEKALKNKKALYNYVLKNNPQLFNQEHIYKKRPHEIACDNKNTELAELLNAPN